MLLLNVPLSQEGKNLPKPTITITLSYASTGPNTFCTVTSDYAVRSTITINYTISWSGKHGFNTYQGSTTISKGSTDGGEIDMTVAAPGPSWSTTDIRSIFGSPSPSSDEWCNYVVTSVPLEQEGSTIILRINLNSSKGGYFYIELSGATNDTITGGLMVGGGGFTTVELNEGRTHLSAYWRETPLGDNMVATISPSIINAVAGGSYTANYSA